MGDDPRVPTDEAVGARGQFHFDADNYLALVTAEVPAYDRLQDAIAAECGTARVRRVLDLGTGTGVTAARVAARHPEARIVGIDESPTMLDHARRALPRADLRVSRLEDPLPDGPFDLVVSALAVHHLSGSEKADLFMKVARVLSKGGRFVLGDVVAPDDPRDAVTPINREHDHPSPIDEQLGWLADAGFRARTAWRDGDLAVLVGELESER